MKSVFELAAESFDVVEPCIRKGLPTATLHQAATRLGIPTGNLAEKLGISKRTVIRKRSGAKPFSIAESEKLLRLGRICNILRTLFRSDDAVAEWLEKPDAALGQRAPIDLLDTEIGAREVEDLIQSLSYGQFV
jgi:putative toxin-antitoxin system antitoxin component (TIGR02293 family)